MKITRRHIREIIREAVGQAACATVNPKLNNAMLEMKTRGLRVSYDIFGNSLEVAVIDSNGRVLALSLIHI